MSNQPMRHSPARLGVRLLCFRAIFLAWTVMLLGGSLAIAHPGHDHSHGGDHDHAEAAGYVGNEAASTTPNAVIEPDVVTQNQTDIADIFAQSSIINAASNTFGVPIRVDFNPLLVLDRPEFRTLDTQAEQQALFNLSGPGIASSFADALNVYYIDDVVACGNASNPRFVGCGSVNGNDVAIESSFAASSFGAELLGHEIAHNLGLNHIGTIVNGVNSVNNNLLNPVLNNDTTLTATQANQILNNQRVNFDSDTNEFFITVNPIIISPLAVSIPEPATVGLGVSAFALLTATRRGRRPG